uniref:Uncharacterized protein n=1 Tax=Anguilla anguilla TaxID=7936 RepID=A0A0E9XKF6_ANGAN
MSPVPPACASSVPKVQHKQNGTWLGRDGQIKVCEVRVLEQIDPVIFSL